MTTLPKAIPGKFIISEYRFTRRDETRYHDTEQEQLPTLEEAIDRVESLITLVTFGAHPAVHDVPDRPAWEHILFIVNDDQGHIVYGGEATCAV